MTVGAEKPVQQAGVLLWMRRRAPLWAAIVVFLTIMSSGIALVAHSHPGLRGCSHACRRAYAWMSLPTSTFILVGVGVGLGICAVMAGSKMVAARLRLSERIVRGGTRAWVAGVKALRRSVR